MLLSISIYSSNEFYFQQKQNVSCAFLFITACGKIRAATGKAMLLVNKKFKQFKGLCDMNLVSCRQNIVSFTSSSLDSGLTWPINSDIGQDEMVTKDIKMVTGTAWPTPQNLNQQHLKFRLAPPAPTKVASRYGLKIKGTGSLFSACPLIELLFSNLLLILSVNNPTQMYLRDLRVYFKVEVYFRVTWSRMEEY